MEPYPKLFRFEMVFSNKSKPKKYTINDFHMIETYIKQYGLLGIRMIIFYFDTRHYPHYPYGIHPIVLRPYPRGLQVNFFHFYNSMNQRCELSLEQQYYDYHSMYNTLLYNDSLLLHYIQYPKQFSNLVL